MRLEPLIAVALLRRAKRADDEPCQDTSLAVSVVLRRAVAASRFAFRPEAEVSPPPRTDGSFLTIDERSAAIIEARFASQPCVLVSPGARWLSNAASLSDAFGEKQHNMPRFGPS